MTEDTRIDAQRKAELLSTTVEHIDITSFDARPIIDAMGKMSFTSRDTSRALAQVMTDPAERPARFYVPLTWTLTDHA